MAKEKEKKTEKRALEPYRPAEWLTPSMHIDDMFEGFFRRPWLSGMPRLFEDRNLSPSVDIFEDGDDVVVKTELPESYCGLINNNSLLHAGRVLL